MDETNRKIYDIGIIGAGPAGMTAAIYASRANKSVVILDENGFGGMIATSPKVENFPGVKAARGIDIADNLFEHMMSFETVNYQLAKVNFVSYCRGLVKITTSESDLYFCKSLIIATGTEHKKLTLDRPTKIDINYCVTCDGAFYKDQDVLVVGSGNSGGQYALELAQYCNHVYICDITSDLCCENDLKQKILTDPKITWLPNKTVSWCRYKENRMTSAVFKDESTINVNGVFVAIGLVPNTKKVEHLVAVDKDGYVIAAEDCATNIPGIFVAGDCRTKKIRQAVTAAADGAIAALGAIRYIDGRKW